MTVRDRPHWHFLTNHGAVVVYVALYPNATVREISEGVEITERYAARILSELRRDGYVAAVRQGRRNSYTIVPDLRMRRAATSRFSVAQLLAGLLEAAGQVPAEPARGSADFTGPP